MWHKLGPFAKARALNSAWHAWQMVQGREPPSLACHRMLTRKDNTHDQDANGIIATELSKPLAISIVLDLLVYTVLTFLTAVPAPRCHTHRRQTPKAGLSTACYGGTSSPVDRPLRRALTITLSLLGLFDLLLGPCSSQPLVQLTHTHPHPWQSQPHLRPLLQHRRRIRRARRRAPIIIQYL